MKITILGCGPSSGIPAINGYWGNCDPKNPKNIRQRSSILIEINEKNILIDTSPDIKNQFKNSNIKKIDAVLYTHSHSDHTLGIHDLSFLNSESKIPIYGSDITMKDIFNKFSYLFNNFSDKELFFPINHEDFDLKKYKKPFFGYKIDKNFKLFNNIDLISFDQIHGKCISSGYRINDFAYSTDISDLPEKSKFFLNNLDLWIISCCKFKKHSENHANYEKIIKWINELKPKKAILTHMGVEMDYDYIKSITPQNIDLAYDGMVIFQ